MTFEVTNPFPVFTDLDGSPLENGNIYIGVLNLNPETNPVSVFWDSALTIPVAQPIRTLGGYPSFLGSPGKLFTSTIDLSITVRNKKNELIFSDLAANEAFKVALINASTPVNIAALTALLKANLDDGVENVVSGYYTQGDGGGGRFYWDSASTATANGGTVFEADEGGTGRWLRIINTVLNVKMFGAVGDGDGLGGGTDDSTAIGNFYAALADKQTGVFPAGYIFRQDTPQERGFDIKI